MAENAYRRFLFGSPAVCQQSFTHAGREFKAGEPFPYTELGLGREQMRGYWLASLVDFVEAAPAKPAKPDKRETRAAR